MVNYCCWGLIESCFVYREQLRQSDFIKGNHWGAMDLPKTRIDASSKACRSEAEAVTSDIVPCQCHTIWDLNARVLESDMMSVELR